ncbi:ribosomal protein S18-alanine N-acetyltransferase [Flagellatimonas centrodinii]|uniref:ribosomal protein S18-alanine N-acetyltransferase n=1 Tax=Flagellatimonas centrodinii TaxID=2806210 RepID=UPI001FF06E70|nr:ribosomal protein S18-alanine N-acetyltransferase [Flagellatimonas centrodinii]ULQ46099.1 ribosomal protein S18-alanine N-acetyltransferase [Flagellatimonas centrodinii]
MSARADTLWRLQPMHPLHLDAVLDIEHRAYPFPWSRGVFEDCLRVGYSCWVANDSIGRILGYGVMTMAVGEAHLLNICVDPAQQRRGLACYLLDHLIDIARHAGTEHLFLEVRGSNTPAIRLYERYGFAQVGLRRDYYPAADGREDARVMALQMVPLR